jgi:hypothetical protein
VRLSRGTSCSPLAVPVKLNERHVSSLGVRFSAMFTRGLTRFAGPRFPGEPSPCDGCKGAALCSMQRFACGSFVAFVQGAPPERWNRVSRIASREMFREVFRRVTPQSGRRGSDGFPSDLGGSKSSRWRR